MNDGAFSAIWNHNWFRSRVAIGKKVNQNGTALPTAKNMYAVVKFNWK